MHKIDQKGQQKTSFIRDFFQTQKKQNQPTQIWFFFVTILIKVLISFKIKKLYIFILFLLPWYYKPILQNNTSHTHQNKGRELLDLNISLYAVWHVH